MLQQPVLARFSEERGHLRGRYFYTKVGIDIPIEGSASLDGMVSLVEGQMAESSGRFEGSCDAKTGALAGTWSGAHASGPFLLTPIESRDPPLVAKKRFVVRTSASRADAGRVSCTYSEEALEFFGVANPEAERKLNHEGIEPSLGPWIAPRRAEEARQCVYGFDGQVSESLINAFRGFVTIGYGGSAQFEGTAHPLVGSEFEPVRIFTADLTTGAPVESADIFARDPIPLVTRCAGEAWDHMGAPTADLEFWTVFNANRFWLTERGVRFFADGFPHAYALFNEQGPLLPYAVLDQDGYLRKDSPVRRAWASIPTAPPGVVPCPPGEEDRWWEPGAK